MNEGKEEVFEIEIIEIEIYVREGKPIPKDKHYNIRVNQDNFVIKKGTITGREILALAHENPEEYTLYQHFHHGKINEVQPNDHVDLTAPGVEHFTTKEKQVEVIIIVNAREKTWTKKTISYEEVVILAFGAISPDPNVVYTVTYSRGHESKPNGSLAIGQSVKVKKGMKFNVTPTNKS